MNHSPITFQAKPSSHFTFHDLRILALCTQVKIMFLLSGSCFEFAKPRNEKHKSSHNNKWDCVRGGGKWVEFSSFFEIHSASNTKEKCAEFGRRNPHLRIRWAIPHFTFGLKDLHPTIELNKRCLILPPPVKCEVAPTSRPNHLGNGEAKVALRHTWILPYSAIGERKRCVFRIRCVYVG